jgi:SAM-dependent methyltransferase
MKLGTITNALKSWTMDIDSWTSRWEKDEKYMNAMQEVKEALNTFNVSLMFIKPNSNVLACGCGPGREARILITKGCKVTAVDHSQNMIDISKKNEPRAKYILGDITKYKEQNKYDYITCLFNTMNCLGDLKNRKKFILNSYINLKKGGKLIIDSSDRSIHWKVYLRAMAFKNDFYYKSNQVELWFENTNFKVERMKTNQGNIIIATKY